MKKRKAVQLTIEFFVDLISLIIATGTSYAISLAIDKIPTLDFHENLTYFVLQFVSFCLIFFGFSNSLDLTKRDRIKETVSVFRNSFLIFMTFAVLLVLAKNEMIMSRYLFYRTFPFKQIYFKARNDVSFRQFKACEPDRRYNGLQPRRRIHKKA